MAVNEAAAAEVAAAPTTSAPVTPSRERDPMQETLTSDPRVSVQRAVFFDEAPDVEMQKSRSAGASPTDSEFMVDTRSEFASPRRFKSWGGEVDEDESGDDDDQSHLIRTACVLLVVLVLFPLICRKFLLPPSVRCGLVIFSMVLINVNKIMPLFCTALAVPVLGTLCSVLGDARGVKETSTLMIMEFFNVTSFMILGMFVINGIFMKCGLDRRLMRLLLKAFSLEGPLFLLSLMVGEALVNSILPNGSLTVVAVLQTIMATRVKNRTLPPNAAKRLLLGAAFASNISCIILPISGVINLITVSIVRDFGYRIDMKAWVEICLPVAMVTMLLSWLTLLLLYPVEKVSAEVLAASEQTRADAEEVIVDLTDRHIVFMAVGVLAVLGTTVYARDLEPIIGHPACSSLALIVIVFGSGFMSRDEFCNLDWDILAFVGGLNVVGFLVRETGLGVEMAGLVVKVGAVNNYPYHGILAVMVVTIQCMSGTLMHGITGVVVVPLAIAIGIKLQAVETTAILCAAAISTGMFFPHSSFDNVISQKVSRELGRRTARLKDTDWHVSGGLTSLWGAMAILTVGYHQASRHFRLPPPMWQIENMMPEGLLPKMVPENLPWAKRFSMDLLSIGALPEQLQPLGGAAAQLTAARPRRRALHLRQGLSLNVVAPPVEEGGK